MATKSLMDQAADITAKNTITPTTTTFDESKGVAGRVDAITSKDSPLMQTAATKGAQAAAARGLTNSSLGIQAGQQAVLETATPIASADASLYSQAQLANMAATNSAATANANIGATLGGQALGLENSNTQQDKSLMQAADQFSTTSKQNQQTIDNQASQNAAQLAQSGKQFDVNAQQNQAQIDNQARQYAAQLAQNQGQYDTTRADTNQNTAAQLAQRQAEFVGTQAQQTAIAQMDAASRQKLAEIQANSQQAIGSNENIANAWGSLMNNITAIQNNGNLDGPAKATLIQNQLNAFNGYANFFGKATSIDVSDLLNFGTAAGGTGATGSVNTPAPAPATRPGGDSNADMWNP